jgi:CyaY protein
MTESEFNDMIDQTFEALELALDEVEDDLDYDTGGGVLTVEHFAWNEQAGDWCDTRDGKSFRPFVVEQMREQAGIDFAWG